MIQLNGNTCAYAQNHCITHHISSTNNKINKIKNKQRSNKQSHDNCHNSPIKCEPQQQQRRQRCRRHQPQKQREKMYKQSTRWLYSAQSPTYVKRRADRRSTIIGHRHHTHTHNHSRSVMPRNRNRSVYFVIGVFFFYKKYLYYILIDVCRCHFTLLL